MTLLRRCQLQASTKAEPGEPALSSHPEHHAKGANRPPSAFWSPSMHTEPATPNMVPLPVVVFGRDDKGKPHASRFRAADAELAEKAAGLMGMRVLRVASDEQETLAAKLPPGRVFASGRGFVPFVKAELLAKLEAAPGAFAPDRPMPSPAPQASPRAGIGPSPVPMHRASRRKPLTALARHRPIGRASSSAASCWRLRRASRRFGTWRPSWPSAATISSSCAGSRTATASCL